MSFQRWRDGPDEMNDNQQGGGGEMSGKTEEMGRQQNQTRYLTRYTRMEWKM